MLGVLSVAATAIFSNFIKTTAPNFWNNLPDSARKVRTLGDSSQPISFHNPVFFCPLFLHFCTAPTSKFFSKHGVCRANRYKRTLSDANYKQWCWTWQPNIYALISIMLKDFDKQPLNILGKFLTYALSVIFMWIFCILRTYVQSAKYCGFFLNSYTHLPAERKSAKSFIHKW